MSDHATYRHDEAADLLRAVLAKFDEVDFGELKAGQDANTAQVENIESHLSKLNGQVAAHEERLNQIALDAATKRVYRPDMSIVACPAAFMAWPGSTFM